MEMTFSPGSNGRKHEDKLSGGREKKKYPGSQLSLLKKYSKMDLVYVMNITGKRMPGSVNNLDD